jgi:hypothetical protein
MRGYGLGPFSDVPNQSIFCAGIHTDSTALVLDVVGLETAQSLMISAKQT